MGLKFPDVSKPETLERRYAGKMNEIELSLMRGLLDMDHKKRFTAYDALMHAYFDDIRENIFENEVDYLIEKPIVMSNRALSPDALNYGKNSN